MKHAKAGEGDLWLAIELTCRADDFQSADMLHIQAYVCRGHFVRSLLLLLNNTGQISDHSVANMNFGFPNKINI